ncbi:30S ribosomal protein S8 [Ichthyobacterium seriolicida]|uniref:Small ribosomal subunit protein uS8 n=1 Tax=Ichthyobacterium seriolicida TaxID=242600 RepID=A0A1J1E670_9FLAO|nr:30S ribosomal protein S8 [Ichthyobacterium seriolicida]BAV94822.1 30S ribosomal protein S8 [Ichthyobacterium seriolicida]
MLTDPIADYLTRIRNSALARNKVVEIPSTKIKRELTKILYDQGFILSYKFDDLGPAKSVIKIALKYDKTTNESVLKKLVRVSKPGLRKYCSSKEIPRVLNGLGLAIVSTSNGVMTGKQAKKENVGGEVLCYIS